MVNVNEKVNVKRENELFFIFFIVDEYIEYHQNVFTI